VTTPKPTPPAPGAAKESDTKSGLIRIIELSAKWQKPLSWTNVLEAAKENRLHRAKIFELNSNIGLESERRLLERLRFTSEDEADLLHNLPTCGGEDYEKMQVDARMYGLWSDKSYKEVLDARQELTELKSLVRQHIPQLLAYVPDVDFGVEFKAESDVLFDFPEVDHNPLRRELKKLEDQARVLLSGNPPGGDAPNTFPEETDYPFGMKIDVLLKVVRRFNKAIGQETVCRIENDDQWDLLLLVAKSGGSVSANLVRTKLTGQSERDRTISRLRAKLLDIQLTINYEKGNRYVLKEFQG
jgi:hypothetical protein